jgi:TolA-binding protein
MKRATCDHEWQVDALRDGRLGPKEAASFQRHRGGCDVCSERLTRAEGMRELGRAIGGGEPSELELRRLRGRVLRDAAALDGAREPGGGSRVRWAAMITGVAIAGSVAAGVVVTRDRAHAPVASPVVASLPSPAASPSGRAAAAEKLAGDVIASTGTRWAQSRDGSVERVRLDDGTLAAHVRPLGLEESFLVELPDGEIEVRGTTFEVTVQRGATTRVHVDEGTVELRLHGRPAASLGPGQTWQAPAQAQGVSASRAAPPSSSPPASPAAASSSSSSPVPPADEGSSEYADALAKLNQGQLDAAAAAFRAFVLAHPRAPQAEDASFLEAVALARAGRSDAAAVVAERHLASFPQSFHRKEAAILVARAASARGDCEKARQVLHPWLGPPADTEATAALRTCSSVGP